MIYCISLIIIVALICATKLYPLWLEHDRKRVDKAMKIVAALREENNRLRKDHNDAFDAWWKEFNRKEKVQSEILDKLYELFEKIEINHG